MPISPTGKKKDGKVQYRVRVNYTDAATGEYRRIERYTYGKAEAQALELTLLQSVTSADPSGKVTVAELAEEYMKSHTHDVRETSMDKARRVISNVVLPELGNVRLSALTPHVLEKWKNQIAERDLAITTKQSYYRYFHAMLEYAVKHGYLPANPLNRVGNFKEVYFEKPQDRIHYYTEDQFRKYIAQARASAEAKDTIEEWGYYIFFVLAFFLGTRKGETNALRWSDIDGNIVHVRRSVSQVLKGEDRETPPKNRSSYRDILLPNRVISVLEEHKARQQSVPGFSEDWRVCGGTRALRDTMLNERNCTFAAAAGVPHIRIHDFRHSHASLLCNNGINIQEIARRLGHANVQMTWNIYSHMYPRQDEKAAEILEKIDF